jgi:hypothetical protein
MDYLSPLAVTVCQRLVDKGCEFQYMSPEICRYSTCLITQRSFIQFTDLAEGQ